MRNKCYIASAFQVIQKYLREHSSYNATSRLSTRIAIGKNVLSCHCFCNLFGVSLYDFQPAHSLEA